MPQSSRARLSVHPLEGREVPAVVISQPAPDTIGFLGNDANDVIQIRDNGSGRIYGSATGHGSFAFGGVKSIRIHTSAGVDRVVYNLIGNLQPNQQQIVLVDLGHSRLRSGPDQFVANLYNSITGVGSDLLAGVAALSIDVNGGDAAVNDGYGRDVIIVNAFRGTDVAAGAVLDMYLVGDAGNDTIAVHWRGENDGTVSLHASGQDGNDTVRGRLREAAGSTGKLHGGVSGGYGNYALTLLLYNRKPPTQATLDGGAGTDTAVATLKVIMFNIP